MNTNLADQTNITVRVTGNPFPKVKIMKDNKEISIKDRFKLQSNAIDDAMEYILSIDNTQANDSGIYKFEATNKCGSVFTTVSLAVIGNT